MTRRRQLFIAALTMVASCVPAVASAQKLIFVVRHAERADAGMQAQTDPPLSAIGESRAAKLATMLADAGVKDIFVTEFKRTQDTAKPLASKLGVTAEQASSKDTDALIAKIKSHPNDVVLVVGHQNTVPAILKAFGGPDVTIADAEYDNLFVIVPATGVVTRIRFSCPESEVRQHIPGGASRLAALLLPQIHAVFSVVAPGQTGAAPGIFVREPLTRDTRMRIAIVGAGAVGGYYGALLSRSGVDVSLIARGAHLEAIRARGLQIVSPLGDFVTRPRAESDPKAIGDVDVVILAVKTYDNATALPLLPPLVGPGTCVLTLQNGVDSADEVAVVVGKPATMAGATYIATAIEAPGIIRQTGTHRRIVFGEVFGEGGEISARVRAIETVMKAADIQAEAVVDARVPIWEKFIYLAPFAAFTGAARAPIGPLWSDEFGRAAFLDAVREVERVARGSGVNVAAEIIDRIATYTGDIPPATRSSLLIDLAQGKRIEVESLPGSVVRRGLAVGVPTPMMAALYAVLKPHAGGRVSDPGLRETR